MAELDLALLERNGNVVTPVDPFVPGEFFGQVWVNAMSRRLWWWDGQQWIESNATNYPI